MNINIYGNFLICVILYLFLFNLSMSSTNLYLSVGQGGNQLAAVYWSMVKHQYPPNTSQTERDVCSHKEFYRSKKATDRIMKSASSATSNCSSSYSSNPLYSTSYENHCRNYNLDSLSDEYENPKDSNQKGNGHSIKKQYFSAIFIDSEPKVVDALLSGNLIAQSTGKIFPDMRL